MEQIQKIIKDLITKYGITKEILAGKMGVSVFTIFRWLTGKTKPRFAEEKLLKQIYNGYLSRKVEA